MAGRPVDARAPLEECLAIARRGGDDVRATLALGNLGLVALSEERWGDAIELHVESLRLSNRRGNRRGAAEALLGLALAHAGLDDARGAVELHGAFQRLCDTTGIDAGVAASQTGPAARLLDPARSRLDPVTLEALTARGRSLTPEQVLELFDERGLSERERRDSNPRPPA